MTRSIFNVFSRLLSLALVAACCAPLAAQTVVFENVRPVDVESATTGEPTSVLDGMLADIEERANPTGPD